VRRFGSLTALVVVALLLRSTALSALSARGVVIDVLVFVTVLRALRHGEAHGATVGFVLGLCADLDAVHWPGRHALALTLIGYGVGRLSHTLVRDRASTQFAVLALGTLVHQTWTLAFEVAGAGDVRFLVVRVLLALLATPTLGTAILGAVRRVTGQPLFGHAALPARA
jgi:rod shape-determining protein MreD